MDGLKRFFLRLMGIPVFNQLVLEKDVVETIGDFARANAPNEFVALLKGEVVDGALRVNGLVYQHFNASRTHAFLWMNLPVLSGVVGSVHSHPSVGRPSLADLRFFNKQGGVHLIISYPYRMTDIVAYSSDGTRIDFSVE